MPSGTDLPIKKEHLKFFFIHVIRYILPNMFLDIIFKLSKFLFSDECYFCDPYRH